MTWIDRLRKGSFEGIEFHTTGDVFTPGHRVVIDENPFANDASSRVLGRRARRFEIEFFFNGDDYDLDRDRFIAQLDKSPVGILVHPRYGEHRVTIVDCSISDQFADGSKCDVSVTFVHTPAGAENPRQSVDRAFAPSTSIKAAKVAVAADLANNVDLTTSAAQANFYNFVDNAATSLRSTLQQLDNLLAVPGNYAGRVRNLAEGITSAPTRLWTTLDAEFTGLMRDLEAIANAVVAIVTLDFLNVIPSPGNTTDVDIAAQANLVQRTAKSAVLLNAANTLTSLKAATDPDAPGYKTTQQVQEAVVWLTAAVEDLIENYDPPDDVILALKEVLTNSQNYLEVQLESLPTLVTYTPQQDLPACVIAHLLYGDATRGDRIGLQNGIADLSAVPGGRPLKVLDR